MRPSAALTKTSPSAVTSQGVASAPTRQRQVSKGSPRPGSVTGASRSWNVSFTKLYPQPDAEQDDGPRALPLQLFDDFARQRLRRGGGGQAEDAIRERDRPAENLVEPFAAGGLDGVERGIREDAGDTAQLPVRGQEPRAESIFVGRSLSHLSLPAVAIMPGDREREEHV